MSSFKKIQNTSIKENTHLMSLTYWHILQTTISWKKLWPYLREHPSRYEFYNPFKTVSVYHTNAQTQHKKSVHLTQTTSVDVCMKTTEQLTVALGSKE